MDEPKTQKTLKQTGNPVRPGIPNMGSRYGAPHYAQNMAARLLNMIQDQGTQQYHSEDVKVVQFLSQTEKIAYGPTGPQDDPGN